MHNGIIFDPLKKDTFINHIYQCIKKISAGSFGTVYSGVNIETKEEVAIKIEKIDKDDMRSVFREVQFLKRLESVKGIPKLFWHGSEGRYDIMVMSLLGKDLSGYLKIYHKFSLKTVVLLADQILSILEDLHNAGIVHRDLKPENIVLGRGENSNQVFLIDFGISKIYKDTYGRHVPYRDKKSFIGTARYASIAAHDGIEISRKDDLESLGYVLVYLLKGYLPWQSLNITEKEKCKKVGELKAGIKPEELLKDYPEELVKYMNYVRGLGFKETPDYNFLKGLFIKVAINRKYIIDNVFDWSVAKNVSKNSITNFKKEEINIKSLEHLPNNFNKKEVKISSLADIDKEEEKKNKLEVPSKIIFENSSRSRLNSIGGSLAINFDNSINNIIDADLSLIISCL